MPTGKTIALLIYPTISHVTATLGIARALREKENRIIYPVFEDLQEFIENHYRQSYRDHGYGLYTVELKENRKPVGMCGLW